LQRSATLPASRPPGPELLLPCSPAVQGVSSLVRLISAKAVPKRFGGGGLVTGPVLAGLVEAYVAAINSGAVPTIATAWQVGCAMCARRGHTALRAGLVTLL
jgi:hypothetical protein